MRSAAGWLLGLVCAAVTAAPVAGLAAGAPHPPVATREGCVTRQCHARLLEPGEVSRERSAHQPAADGECASCHDLALPGRTRLLRGVPAGADEGPERARAWDLALCGECHGGELHARDAPPGATGFADGTKNLHALHVQAGRGRRCLPCHDPHAARQPLLLRERIPARGGAVIPQQFRREPGGGWCRTGCHAPKGYRR